MAPIAVGDVIPDGNLYFINEEGEFKTVSIYSIVTGKKVVLLGVPGAFMPDCRRMYVPEFIEKTHNLKSKGIQTLCISVNDPFVVKGWELTYFRNNPHINFLADSTAAYVTSLGLELDLTSGGFGIRSRRFALVLADRKVIKFTDLCIEDFLSPSLSFSKRATPYKSMAPIAVGDIIPDGELTFINNLGQIEPVSIYSIVTGKKVIVLGVTGAFMPTCSNRFISTFIEKADELKSKGVQEILCISVNDPFVMRGWKLKRLKDNKHITFLADSTAAYATSLGFAIDASCIGYGIRSKRFAVLLEDRRVKVAEVDIRAKDMLVAMAEAEFRDMEI